VKFLGIIGVILLALSILAYYELRVQTQRFTVHTVEGPVIGRWEKTDRVRNHPDGVSQYRTRKSEGFQVGGVPFPYAIEIRDGMTLRISYFYEGERGPIRITRVERLNR